MKLIKRLIIACVLVLSIIILWINSNIFISNQSWKYRDGFHIGDWVEFNSTNISLTGKSITRDGKEVARVYCCLWKMLIIKDIKTGKKGHYINKS